jgi:CBS domain-containing protein
MQVREGMSRVVLVVGPGHTLRAAGRLMAERRVGAAVVLDPDMPGPGIITERDVAYAVGTGADPDHAVVADHMASDLVYAAPDWSLEEAAVTMVRCGFRHLVVVQGGEMAGVLSMRDVVRCWTDDGSICELPSSVTGPEPVESRRGLRSWSLTSVGVEARGGG